MRLQVLFKVSLDGKSIKINVFFMVLMWRICQNHWKKRHQIDVFLSWKALLLNHLSRITLIYAEIKEMWHFNNN